jgi:hypothetical protein
VSCHYEVARNVSPGNEYYKSPANEGASRMDHCSAPYPMSANPDDEQQFDAVAVQYPPIPETIELLNIPFRRDNSDDGDDDNLSFYLGTEHISLLSRNLIPSHRDLSQVSCNDCATIIMDTTRQNIFPVLLHHLLSDNAREQQASFMWLPHGRAFVITDMAQFCSTIVPLIFNNTNIYTHRYEVFIGLLESYGFQKVVSSLGLTAFYHKVRNGVLSLDRFRYILCDTHPFSQLQYKHETLKLQRFLKFRWWLAGTMDLIPTIMIPLTTQRSQAQAQCVFDCLPLLPTLEYDADLSYSAVVNRHFMM